MNRLLLLAMMAGCPADPDTMPDGGTTEPDASIDAGRPFDFFGESCASMPYPVNTTCHNDRGWCIDDVCRPMCGPCPAGTTRYAPAGACYCAP